MIWTSTLDDVWVCRVERVSPYLGELTVRREGEPPILREKVPVSYNAPFGPDVADVTAWQERCAEVVDSLG